MRPAPGRKGAGTGTLPEGAKARNPEGREMRIANLLVGLGCWIIVAASPSGAAGADWPCFRGPGGSGVSEEKGLPTTWSDDEGIVWRTALPGAGSSSPIVSAGRIFVTCYSGYGVEGASGGIEDLKRHVVCIDPKA